MTEAQVIKLSGKAWAINGRGERRALKEGDRVQADEMIITDVGASIELDLGDAGLITLQGEHSSPLLEELLSTPEHQPLPSLDTPQDAPAAVSGSSGALKGEGGKFVQLVRIAEILEADGYQPVRVKRIEELLKPLGMSYPDRSRAYEEEREYLQKPNHSTGNPEITATISIDVIAGDDIINAAEAQQDITVSGSVGGNVKPGDTVTVTVNGKTYETTVNPDGKTWNVDIPGSELVQDSSVQASVTAKGSGGKTATADAERPYAVDTDKPELNIPPQSDEDADKIDLDLRDYITDNQTPVDELEITVDGLPEGLEYDPGTGKITGTIDKSASQNGPDNDGKYTVTVTVTDKAGNSNETTFEWQVDNPPPVAADDKQTIDEDTVAEGNVLTGRGNDPDVNGTDNDPDGDTLRVKDFTVNGTTYPPGDTATILDGEVVVGTITVKENGDYTFTPTKDWNGTVPEIGYTITDGEGGEDSATLGLIVTPVNDAPASIGKIDPIENADADSGDSNNPLLELDLDSLFNDVDGDELTYSAEGLPPGLEFDPETGTITGTIDKSASQGGPNNDGKYTVTIIAKDPDGEKAEQTFTWTVTNPAPEAEKDDGETFKTQRLIKDAESGLLANDSDPDGDDLIVQDIRHKDSEPVTANEEGELVITGDYGTLVVKPDGSYVYTPDLSQKDGPVWTLSEGKTLTDTFTYTVSDGEGGTGTSELKIEIKGHSNTPPFLTVEDKNGADVDGQVTVHEKGLAGGSEPGEGHTASGVINVHAMDGLSNITIGTETINLEKLKDLGSGNTITIDVEGGKMTLTGFEPFDVEFEGGATQTLGGEIYYTYTLTEDREHGHGEGNNSLVLEIQLGVTDDQGASSDDDDNKLIVNVIDDVPVAVEDTSEIDEDKVSVGGDVLTNDKQGADGANVTGVQAGTVAADSHTDGNLGTDITGDFGSLKLNADGTYTYTLDNSNLEVQGLIEGDKLTDTFTYTITDADGDKSTTTLTITINGKNDVVTVDIPEEHNVPIDGDGKPTDPADYTKTDDQVVFESGLSTGSNPNDDAIKVDSSFTIEALDGLDPDAAVSITYKDENGDEKTLEITKDELEGLTPGTSQTITTQYGKLVLNGYNQATDGKITIDYEYTLINAPEVPGVSTNDDFTIKASNRDTDEDTKTLSIKIIDDAPTAKDDANEVTEGEGIDAVSTTTGNVMGTGGDHEPSASDVADTTGADGATVTDISSTNVGGNVATETNGVLEIKGEYGTLTIQPDGSYSYELDNSNLDVQGMIEGDSKTDIFNYTITDGDGDTDSANLVITIKGANDGVEVSVPNPNDPNDYPVEDPDNPDNPTWGTINDHVVFESGLVGGSQNSSDTDAVNDLVMVKSSFTLSALDGLAGTDAIVLKATGNTLSLSKADVEALSSTVTKSIATGYGKLVLNGYTHNADGTITIDYEYTLTSAPENTAAGDGTDAGKFTDDTIKITVNDRDSTPDTATEDLVIRIMDDVPTVSATGTLPTDLVVDESTMGTSAEGSFASAFKHHFGADGAATTDRFVYSLDIDNTAEGLADLKDTLTGAPIKLELEADGTVKGVVDGGSADGETIFTVTVDNDGKVILKQERAMHHDEPDKVGAADVLRLPTDSIKLTATVTDKDGDTDTASIELGGKLVFQDDGPSIETGADGKPIEVENATVKESYLSSGSDHEGATEEERVKGTVATQKLPIDFGADGVGSLEFAKNENDSPKLSDDFPKELKSAGQALEYKFGFDANGNLDYSTITAKAGSKDIFTAKLGLDADGKPQYTFTLKGPLDHILDAAGAKAENIVLPFDITATDGDGDSVNLKFKVEVVDDTPKNEVRELTVDEDGSVSFSNADVSQTTTTIKTGEGPQHGTVTIANDGKITYTPNEDYRGRDSYTYTVTTASGTYERTVNITVKPVADAPLFADRTDGGVVVTPEDTEKSLGLKLPAIKDIGATGQNDPGYSGTDYSELLGAITLTPSGAGYIAGDTKFTTKVNGAGAGAEIELKPVGGKITIVITDTSGGATPSDGYHVKGDIVPTKDESNGVYYLTKEEYEAITAHPAADRHENFKVEVSVDSYEVDADGEKLTDVDGANSKQTITVDVRAVTDKPELKLNNSSYTFDEDTVLDLTNELVEGFKDIDGSESFWYEVEGLAPDTVVTINGKSYTANSEGKINSSADKITVDAADKNPTFTIKPPQDFSGDMDDVKITVKVQDSDDDSPNHTPEIKSADVTFNLHVNPIAGDVGLTANDVTTPEDTAVNFMRNIEVTDKKVGGSNEVITKVVFELPENWKLTKQPAAGEAGDAEWTVSGSDAAGWTIEFTKGTEAEREDALSKFEVTPPAHSSADKTITVTVTTEDTNTVNNKSVTSPAVETELAIKVEVTPVAEKIGGEYKADGKWIPATEISDTDGNGTADLTMTEGYSYKTAGEEDTWFNLNQEAGFALKTGWTNQDGKAPNANGTGVDGGNGSEETFALLTPELIAGDGSQTSANGAKFQWTDKNGDTQTVTFGGDPIEVPIEFLDSLQFKAPENFAGMFKIKVQAKTVDYDEDDPSIKVEAISGEAWLENVLIAPKADTSTTSLTARVEGNEDETMPLSIRPKSSDPAEIFDVTVSAVPNGAMLTYGDYVITKDGVFTKDGVDDEGRIKPGTEITGQDLIDLGISVVTDGTDNWKVSFEDFDSKKDMTVTAPLDSNVEFKLTVSTVTVDKLEIPSDVDISTIDLPTGVHKVDNGDGSFTLVSKSAPENLTIDVAPKGVADPAIVELDDTVSFTEENTDQNGIKLNELFTTLALKDNDGSETLSFKIGGLPAGFTVKGATFMGNGTWSFGTAEYDAEQVTIHPPQNYNGKFNFDFYTITTENDGDSLTEKHEINVTVTPSPEAGMNLASSGDEDTSFQLDFGVKHENGDDDEFVSKVFIKVDSVTDGLTLTLGKNGSALSTTETIDGADYYVVEQSDLNNIYAKGKANWSGETSFKVRYEITDPGKDGLDNVSSVTDTDDTYDVTINPVTDQVTLAVTEGADTTLSAAGTVNVKLNVGNEGQDGGDYDNSEVLTRIIVDNVPDGVVLTNTGAHFIGGGQWVIVSDTEMNGVLEPVIKFQVHSSAGDLTGHEMTVTVISEDAGNGVETTASKTVKLTTTFEKGEAEKPAEITTWEQTAFKPTEDTAFTLKEAINAKIQDGVSDNGFTVTLTDLPEGAEVDGMVKTIVNGAEVWSATGSGNNDKLQELLEGITVTPPLNWNKNHNADEFTYNATLTTHVPSGGKLQSDPLTITPEITPVTDHAVIEITATPVTEGKDLDIRVDISNDADGNSWTLVNDKLYLQVNSAVDGKLYDSTGTTELNIQAVSGVDGIANGNYYVIDLVGGDTSVDLVFKPDSGQKYAKGDVTINAWVQGKETGADNIVTTNQNATTQFQPANSGYELKITSPEGTENPSSNKATDGSNLIEVEVGGDGLKDTTGTEKIDTILLGNLPNGFLVYTGATAADASLAEMANNAGGEGTNTWLLGDEMPKYIGILPPKNWSGTIEGIKFTVISGEENLTEKDVTTVDFDLTATPVANGVTLAPTASFGNEGEIIGLNLNANLKDLHRAGDNDQHVELITLTLKGLGEHASFYIGEDLSMEQVEYDSDTDTYTIKGLSQDDVDNLGFIQANSAIHKDGIKVNAQSQEYEVDGDGNPDLTKPVTVEGAVSDWAGEQAIITNIVDQYGTTDDDRLLYTDSFIDGRGGEDTIQLRFGEEVTGSQLADNLKNIEIIDMSGEASGANRITGLTAKDVFNMTDENNILKILGDSEDIVDLGGEWGAGKIEGDFTTYTATFGEEPVKLEIANAIVD